MKTKLIMVLMLAFLGATAWQPVAAAERVELVPSQRVILEITEGMTIEQIIKRIYPRDREIWPRIKQAVIDNNPDSFVADSDRLIPGQRLKLVDIRRIPEPQDSPPPTRVGVVTGLDGNARRIDADGRSAGLQLDSPVFEGDRIETDPESRLRVRMADGAEVMMKADSVLKITEYVITEGYDAGSSSILDLLRGGLRKITGAIGASGTANYQLRTGMAMIGIRGTDYVVKLCRLDDCTRTASRGDLDAKLHAVVLEGAISLTGDEQVQLPIAAGEYGTATVESLVVEQTAAIPPGLLTAEEARRVDVPAPQPGAVEDQQASGAWKWILAIMLLVVSL